MLQNNGLPGLYVVLEGIVGVGKGTQIERLKVSLPKRYPNIPIVFTHEPGGTQFAEEVRNIVKTQKLEPEEEMELFAQARGSEYGTIPQVVVPKLKEGGIVVSDRSFYSSLAYQGIGRGIGIQKVWDHNKPYVLPHGIPDHIIFLDVTPELALTRKRQGTNNDKFSSEEVQFWNEVTSGYYLAMDMVHREFPHITSQKVSYDIPHTKDYVESLIWFDLIKKIDWWKSNLEGHING